MTKRQQSPSRTKLPNGARAVMAGRKEPPDSLDFFPTPLWATRALFECALPTLGFWPEDDLFVLAWEPACGEGHMSGVLSEYFQNVRASDVYPYGDNEIFDFLSPMLSPPTCSYDWIITNPPFKDSLTFTLRALELARIGVAIFIRQQWLEGCERYERLFKPHPPTLIAHFAERVPLCKGRWDPAGGTATAYCWLVWIHGREPVAPFWIPPGQRKALTRPDDIARFAAWSLPAQEAAE